MAERARIALFGYTPLGGIVMGKLTTISVPKENLNLATREVN